MRLGYSRSKYSISYYAQKTIYVDGKNKSIIVKRFGSDKFIRETYGVEDAKAWAQEQVNLMNLAEKEENGKVLLELSPCRDIPIHSQHCFNGGYLFLQDIYFELGLDRICRAIANKHRFEYNLNSILSRLVYTRILYPSSKRSSCEDSRRFLEQPDFELHQIYRALSVLAQESDYIQATLYKNSLKLGSRKTGIIYYDCTNYYFETEKAEDDRQYGLSKENRPLPIIGMGLFMDADGIPLAFSLYPGNQNEQQTMIPLEEKLMADFGMSRFIVCTDAGLSSLENRKFNDYSAADSKRAFVTTQSIKKLKKFLKEWALDPDGWFLPGDKTNRKYCLTDLEEEADHDKIFYKERWIKENGLEQHLIISYSLRHRNYMRAIRKGQIDRAVKAAENNPSVFSHKRQTDYRRFVKAQSVTKEGEIADRRIYSINEEVIREEEKYDGFYAVCTNLDDEVETIIKLNHWRWEIEECFRIMKTEFEARPVYLQNRDRIQSHFLTCFLSLVIYRYLEKRLENRYSCEQLLDCLKEMNFLKYEGAGYVPTYTRSELTDDLHQTFGFNTSKEIIPISKMKKICAQTKKQTHNVER